MTKMPNYTSTTNACKLCKPMGAMLAFRGIEGTMPFLHGSQGCATYMRRYIISHFNEPMDIASSSLGEKHAVFGGGPNLKLGLKNVGEKFHPNLIGIATTCLTETIGDDLPMLLDQYKKENKSAKLPLLVPVSTPSYSGTHMEGFHAAVRAVVSELAGKNCCLNGGINILPGFISPEDLRHLKKIMGHFDLSYTLLPDISETLDGQALASFEKIPGGGTKLTKIMSMGGAQATIEFGSTIEEKNSAGLFLKENFDVALHKVAMPIGLRGTDKLMRTLEELSGAKMANIFKDERGRLLDCFADGHKYLFGKRALVYGEEDFVIGLTSFLAEIGVQPVLCASGGNSGKLKQSIEAVCDGLVKEMPEIREDIDFFDIANRAAELEPDLLIGHSKGYGLARKLGVPLVRVGYPVHDRIGGQRILHIGYRGALNLFDLIANALLDSKQSTSDIGYSYM